jgi:hypothetical protein
VTTYGGRRLEDTETTNEVSFLFGAIHDVAHGGVEDRVIDEGSDVRGGYSSGRAGVGGVRR